MSDILYHTYRSLRQGKDRYTQSGNRISEKIITIGFPLTDFSLCLSFWNKIQQLFSGEASPLCLQ
jgi:hypothetical protein